MVQREKVAKRYVINKSSERSPWTDTREFWLRTDVLGIPTLMLLGLLREHGSIPID